MQLSSQELDRIIKEEINEIFGRGKKQPSKEYPASEMATITNTLFGLAKKANVEPEMDDREAIVDELEKALAQQGYKLHEQDLTLGDELTIGIDSMPTLARMIGDIQKAIPKADSLIAKIFKRGGITLTGRAPQADQPSSSAPATSVEEYPADEMTTILNVLFSTAKKNEVEVDAKRRRAIIKEFIKVFQKQGVTIAEQKLELGGALSLKIDEETMPETTRLVWTMIGRNPDVRERLTRLFARGGITLEIGDEISDALWDQVRSDNLDASKRLAQKAKLEPDEDQTATIKAEPVAAPDDEDQTATIKAEPVAAPDPEEEDIPSTLTVADPEEEAVDFDDFFLSLDDETLEEFFSSDDLEEDDFMWGTITTVDMKVVNHLLDSYGRIYGLSPQETYETREQLLDDQDEASLDEEGYPMHPSDVRIRAEKAQQKMIALAKDILAKRSRLKEHKQLKRMKVLAGVK